MSTHTHTHTTAGIHSKRRFRLTNGQKYRQRQRLRGVDAVLDTLVESGVKIKALELMRRIPREHEMASFDKYWVKSKRYPNGFKPIAWVPKWTKTPHPRTWAPSVYHLKPVVRR
ncbi:mitochondrial ribosomal protein L31-domain-containing protein [Entophlyctis helioformis]|nr:mitochondrial ribosomal protein L31-domain-containing protein [Entophlyctis helioformis]